MRPRLFNDGLSVNGDLPHKKSESNAGGSDLFFRLGDGSKNDRSSPLRSSTVTELDHHKTFEKPRKRLIN